MRILLAEDNEMIREIVRCRLRDELEATVDAVISGSEAIHCLLQNLHYDVIVSDFEMNNGSGLDLLNFKVSSKLKIPFFFFTHTIRPQIPFPSTEYTLINKDEFDKLKIELLKLKKSD